MGNMPLRIQCNNIYAICQKQDTLVRDIWSEGDWDIPLRRSLHGNLILKWEELQVLLHSVQIDDSSEPS